MQNKMYLWIIIGVSIILAIVFLAFNKSIKNSGEENPISTTNGQQQCDEQVQGIPQKSFSINGEVADIIQDQIYIIVDGKKFVFPLNQELVRVYESSRGKDPAPGSVGDLKSGDKIHYFLSQDNDEKIRQILITVYKD